MNQPYMKFYIRDWVSDSQLRMVSMAARGLWLELLCIMHNAKRRGFLESPNGNRIDSDCLVRLSGTDNRQFDGLMSELLEHGIPSVEQSTGIWYCRRMVRETSKREKCLVAGRRGGSPVLKDFPKEEDIHIPYTIYHTSLNRTGYPADFPSEFDAFWKFYPRKMKKADAQKAWMQTRNVRPPTDELLTAIMNQEKTAQWTKDDGQFIPYPASWLRAHGWENDCESMNRGGSNGNGKPSHIRHADTHYQAPGKPYANAY